jgi:acetyl/propionyl-CoA carboxylase alpha subunit
MSAAAVAAGEALGYVGAGTVEFLLADSGEFFFLEVNTRLQVEHPVTELVTGLDLVELQLLVAEGRPLPPEALSPALDGHAIEARLYAEDPAREFLPVTGTLARFRMPPGVRVDTGVEDGSVISPYYDPMIAKVVAHGATREAAARKLADALARAELHGTITNRDFLVRVLRHPEFLNGAADTSFLERHDPAALAAPLLDSADERLAAAAAALAAQAARRTAARALGTLPSGWRNNASGLQEAAYAGLHSDEVRVGYRLAPDGRVDAVQIGDTELPAVYLHHCASDTVDLEVDGLRRRYRVARGVQGEVHVNTDAGQVSLRELPRFPDPTAAAQAGSLTSPMPGVVIRLLVAPDEQVDARQPLMVLEAMKMEHEIVAPAAGIVTEVRVAEGTQVEAGSVLAVIEE